MTEKIDGRRAEQKPAVNFKQLYNKKYGDIATMNRNHNYTPEQVFELAIRYFTWAEENHIKATETAAFQGVVRESRIHKPRIFTINGFRLFCGFSSGTIDKWRKTDGFKDVMEFVDGVIYEQKFQLAANGIVNSSFIGKDLGIDNAPAVSVENNVTTVDNVSAEDVREAVIDILDKI
ncbi:terminase small subunit [Hafnia phage Pocis76]|uniref:Terminase small subunit n=1 Tax=Hafnia phage Pocis76 TaxID=2831174 RepID=A0A8E7FMF6_9CAUD|nr:terminase small subunit [Hafnia phage Pocis76]